MNDSFDPQPVATPSAPASTKAFDPQPVAKPPRVNLEGPKEPIPNTPPRIVTSDFDPQPANPTSLPARLKENISEGFDQTLVGQAKKNYESGVTLSKAADSVEQQLQAAKAKGQQTVYLPSGGDAKAGRMLGTAQAIPLDEGYRQLAIMRAEADNLKAEYSLSTQLAKEKLGEIQPWARDSHPLLSGMTALAGQVIGGLGSPENFIGTAPERLAATFLRDVGKSALRGAAEMAPVGAAQSSYRQSSEGARGERAPGVNLGELGEDALFAAGFGAGIGGASRGLGRLLGEFKETGAPGSFGSRLDLGDTSTWEKPDFSTQGSAGRAKERVEPQFFAEPTLGEKAAGEPSAPKSKPGRPDVSPEEFADKLPDRQKELLLRDPEHYGEMHAKDPERFPLPEDAYKAKDSGGAEGAARREDGGLAEARPALPDDARLTVFDHAETGRPSDPAEPLAARAPAGSGPAKRPGQFRNAPYLIAHGKAYQDKWWRDPILKIFSPTSRLTEGEVTVSQGKGKPRQEIPLSPTRVSELEMISMAARLAADHARITEAFKKPFTYIDANGRSITRSLAAFSAQLPEDRQRAIINALDDLDDGNKTHPIPTHPIDRAIFDTIDSMTKSAVKLLQSIGFLEKVRFSNSARSYLDKSAAGKVAEMAYKEGSLRGGGNFLHSRNYRFIADAEKEGLQLATLDPLELNKRRLFSMMQYYHGHNLQKLMVDTKMALFVPGYRRVLLGSGLARLNDSAFDRYRYIEEQQHLITHETSVDPQVETALKKVTDLLGIVQRRVLRNEDDYLSGRSHEGEGIHSSGYAFRYPGSPVTAVFGSAQQVMEHEIGHQIDNLHPELRTEIAANSVAQEELKQLSLLRQETAMKQGRVPQDYINNYLLTDPEMMANLFHAYWYAPSVLERTAPTVLKILEGWLTNKGELGEAIRAVEPSLEIAARTKTELVKGEPGHTVYAGSYWAPEPIAALFNNFMSEGLGKYDLIRGAKTISNLANRIHFAISLFHGNLMAIDSWVSNGALAIEQATRGEFKIAAKTAARGLNPFKLWAETYKRGEEVRRSVNSGPLGSFSGYSKIVIDAGARTNQTYWNKALTDNNFWEILKNRTWAHELTKDNIAKTAGLGDEAKMAVNGARIGYKIAEAGTEFIMSHWVPNLKMGVLFDYADDLLRREPNMPELLFKDRIERFSQSVDNRMGQFAYENLFWMKGLKDVAFLALQSFGWELGAEREIKGALVDAARYGVKLAKSGFAKENFAFTSRMAYTTSMFAGAAIIGFITQTVWTFLTTGKPIYPSSWRDFYFPRTGRILANGVPERKNIPSYVKDQFNWYHDPMRTISGKESALISQGWQIITGKDGAGVDIMDPMHSKPQQMWDALKWLVREELPFSLVSRNDKNHTNLNKTWGGWTFSTALGVLGFLDPPNWLVDPAADQAARMKRNVREHRAFVRAHEPGSSSTPPPQIPNITVRP